MSGEYLYLENQGNLNIGFFYLIRFDSLTGFHQNKYRIH